MVKLQFISIVKRLLLYKILLLIALKLELAAIIVHYGERFVKAIVHMNDRPLALQCYEVLSTLKVSIQTSSLSAVSENIGPAHHDIPSHVLPSLCNLYPILHSQRKLPGVLVQPW